jgi:hypothetical protein
VSKLLYLNLIILGACGLYRTGQKKDGPIFLVSSDQRMYINLDFKKSTFEYGNLGETGGVLCEGVFRPHKDSLTLLDALNLQYSIQPPKSDSLRVPYFFSFCDSVEIAIFKGDSLVFKNQVYRKYNSK